MLKLLENNNRKIGGQWKAPEMGHQFTTDILMKEEQRKQKLREKIAPDINI